MTELVKITEHEGRQVISARELHEFLEVKSQFRDWIKNRIEQYDFIEGTDYISFAKNLAKPRGGRPSIDYGLTINMAKECAMVEGNAKGKQARQYFIEVEKKYKQGQFALPSLVKIEQMIEEKISERLEGMKIVPALPPLSNGYSTVSGYGIMHGIDTEGKTSSFGRQATIYSKEHGYPVLTVESKSGSQRPINSYCDIVLEKTMGMPVRRTKKNNRL